MKEVILDFSNIYTRDDVQSHIKEVFGFPEYYGGNLDALYDCLTDICEDTRIVFRDPWTARPVDAYLEKVRKVLSDSAAFNGHILLSFRD